MPQVYKLAILDMMDRFVEIPAGGKLEIDFIKTLLTRVGARNVGALKTQKQVLAVIEEEMIAMFKELKFQTRKVQ
jgi:hypothetical protein